MLLNSACSDSKRKAGAANQQAQRKKAIIGDARGNVKSKAARPGAGRLTGHGCGLQWPRFIWSRYGNEGGIA
jgi:hypothetical protein